MYDSLLLNVPEAINKILENYRIMVVPKDSQLVQLKYGYWKRKPIAGCSAVRCSECENVFLENNGKWNYCPNCGTRMNEERKEDVNE
jgi:DNA-directed RNA polymerase subunit RPC12/RpoP